MKSKNKKSVKKTKSQSRNLVKFWPFVAMVVVLGFFLGMTKYNLSQVQTRVYSPVSSFETSEGLAKQEELGKPKDASEQKTNDAPPVSSEKPAEANPAQPVSNSDQSKKVSTPKSPVPTPTPPPPPPAPAPVASASTVETASSLSYINLLRSSLGKPALAQNSTMNQWALAHASRLASECTLYHQNLNSFLGQNIGPKTVMSIAENVGYASTVSQVLDGLKNSAGHYANMTGDYTYVGLGVVTAGGSCAGYVYTAQMFAK